MNLLEVGVTPDGRYVIAAFQGLPYLFVFDGDHKHIRTIRFAGEAISDHARSYALKTPGMPGTGLRWLIHAVHVLSNEHLMVQIFEIWYVFNISHHGDVMLVGAARLRNASDHGVPNIETIARPSQAQLYKDHLYVGSWRLPYVLRYPFRQPGIDSGSVLPQQGGPTP